MGRSWSRACAAAVGVALAAASAAAATPPTGNVRAIIFYNHEVAIYARLPGAKVVESGYFFGIPSGSKSVNFIWGRPGTTGYVGQTATILEHLNDDQIVAYSAELAAPGLRRVRVLMSGGSVYLSSINCWGRAGAGASPLGTGDDYLFNDGGSRFLPLRSAGGSTSTTFTYTWIKGALARETDTFTSGNRPTVDITIDVTGSERMHIEKHIIPLSTAPSLPVPSPPARPVPKPLCLGS
jgi:hypothetical protein